MPEINDKGPRGRVAGFIERRRDDAGEFVSAKQLPDGYMEVKFEKAVYFMSPDNPANWRDPPIYRADSGYERPRLRPRA